MVKLLASRFPPHTGPDHIRFTVISAASLRHTRVHGGDTKGKMFMYTIDLAYVGRGLHEELVAYIADQRGYYADEGVHVAQRDGCSWNEERLRHAQVSQRLFSTSPGEETL